MTQSSFCKLIILFVILHNEEMTLGFKFLFTDSTVHQVITQKAILQTTVEVCKAQALREGKDFMQPSVLTAESVTEVCSSPASAKGFKNAINTIINENAFVDIIHVLDAEYHFDGESFLKGRDVITEGVKTVKATVQQGNYEVARRRLGSTLHTLQDFYSHSNWIELGNTFPYSNLIRPDSRIDNIADKPTCRNCDGNNCGNNILEDILREKKLTSGYFGLFKPPGKCSHGGFGDISSLIEPRGGINKDTRESNHGHLHDIAASVATAATRDLLQDIRGAVGDSNFLRLMGFSQSSVLCFAIDTTGSMGDDIAEVRRITSLIIDSRRGTVDEPSEYILVPFNDPDFGPLIRTKDPVEFKAQINALVPHGGGDTPELSLSGLLLALTGSPPESKIFVFTDADAKDTHLKNTVLALIESTKSVVNFMLTNSLASRRRREVQDQGQMQQFSSRISNPSNQLYEDLALASGGQAIEVTKGTLSQATSIIVDTSISTLVTVFQSTRNPGKEETFFFIVDSSLINVTIYITGSSPVFNITSPSGNSQSNTELSGKLGLVEHVGNFYTVRLTTPSQTGLWNINMSSLQPYTIKVTGQSDIDFLFDFVEITQGAHPGYSVLKGRPAANSNVTLLLSMVGRDSVTPTEVALVDALGSQTVNGTVEKVAGGDFLVTMNSIPAGEFVVRVIGERNSTSRILNGYFQRQSTTQHRTSSVAITAQADGIWEPGKTLSVPFTVVNNGSGGLFQINARNDRGFVLTFPSTVLVGNGGVGSGTVNLTAPSNTPSGTDVTLTIEAVPPGVSNFNYAVLKLTVVASITDFTSPVCEIVSVNANCSSNCSLSSWELSANLTDGNGTGIETVTVRQGLGTINTSTILGDRGVNVTLVFYRASCCSEDLELVAVDKAGNVGTCSKSIRPTVIPSTTIMPTTVTKNTTLSTTITTNTSLFTITNNVSITANTPLSNPIINTTSITANTSLLTLITNNVSVTANTPVSIPIINTTSITANSSLLTLITNNVTTNTSLTTSFTTKTMATTTAISPFTNATINSAGYSSYPEVCFVSVWASLLFHVLRF